MKRPSSTVLVGAAIVAQVLILIGMVVSAALPLATGTDITVRTRPVDPRDLFRGNYAQLSYDFSRVPLQELESTAPLRTGEVVYVSLQQGENGLYEFAAASLEQPSEGLFLRGRVEYVMEDQVSVLYGIEAFFAPKETALALELTLRERVVATLTVSGSGRARIRAVGAE
ncbi:MAG: GDYXXLXY domain-containing protein [Gammaproteobacteria bacterium]|nr:GDYXXLXY domain-containing protein [Gammaproteobacteria bacterium]